MTFAILSQTYGSPELATAVLAQPAYQFDITSQDTRKTISLIESDLLFSCSSRYLAREVEKAGGSARVAEWVIGKRILGLEGKLNPDLCNDVLVSFDIVPEIVILGLNITI